MHPQLAEHPRTRGRKANNTPVWSNTRINREGAVLSGDRAAPVNLQNALDELNYRKNVFHMGLRAAPYVYLRSEVEALAEDAIDRTDKEFSGKFDFFHNNEADAYRHAIWSYMIAREYGAEAAKVLTDLYEARGENPDEELLMDLFNNAVGIALANDPANQGRDPGEVAMQALTSGQLRVRPFEIEVIDGQEPRP